MNNKETHSPRKPDKEGILKHMTRPTGKIKSATIVTTKVIHVLVVPTTFKKRIMKMTSQGPIHKVNH